MFLLFVCPHLCGVQFYICTAFNSTRMRTSPRSPPYHAMFIIIMFINITINVIIIMLYTYIMYMYIYIYIEREI